MLLRDPVDENSGRCFLGCEFKLSRADGVGSGSEKKDVDRHSEMDRLTVSYFIAPAIGLEADAYSRLGIRPAK